MAYTALYRKLRPKTFNSVIGQNPIVCTLQNQIKTNKVSHAYLFCGTRGTGKTSTAKIFARAVNCTNKKDGEPCNLCAGCVAILENRSMNVLEIDAASNNGVDNIRDIKEEVKYPPTEGVYKIYIIDEVHMLSIGAFNALLKTLEEPPSHVIFILATTDPQKIPATINSRCQRFEFKRISIQDMVNSIKEYIKEEDIDIEEEAIRYIAQISDGAMRDALSILDQCTTFYFNEKITTDKVLNIVGSVDNSVLFSLSEALLSYNSLNCIEIINDLFVNGRDISQFISDLITHFRNLLLVNAVPNISANSLDISETTLNKLLQQVKNIESNIIINYITIFSNLQSQLKFDKNAKILLETTCIKVCNPQVLEGNEFLNTRIAKIEEMLKGGTLPVVTKAVNIEKPKKTFKKAVPDDIKAVISSWKVFVAQFSSLLKGLLGAASPQYLEGEVLYIVANDVSSVNLLKNNEDIIKEELRKKFSKDFLITFISKADYSQRHKDLFGEEYEGTESINQDTLENNLKDKINMDITFN